MISSGIQNHANPDETGQEHGIILQHGVDHAAGGIILQHQPDQSTGGIILQHDQNPGGIILQRSL